MNPLIQCIVELATKHSGITAWSRFPLRLLSLQQTQRFADALGAAELVRRENDIPGDPIALGYYVGKSSTPNDIPVEPIELPLMEPELIEPWLMEPEPMEPCEDMPPELEPEVWA